MGVAGLGSAPSGGQCGSLRQVGVFAILAYSLVLFSPGIFLYMKELLQFQILEMAH